MRDDPLCLEAAMVGKVCRDGEVCFNERYKEDKNVVETKYYKQCLSQSSSVQVNSAKSDDVDTAHLQPHVAESSDKIIPRLKIAMLVVGTRGDVQPFLAVAKKLQEFGHHVRLATHAIFSDFANSSGVEFYPLRGDPRLLAGFMARSRGLAAAQAELSIQRNQFFSIMDSVLPACTDPDLRTGAPFRAQAIISNPIAFGQTHVAEALGVPLHILFTVPWT